ncbi:MAG TPA: 5,6-dimethylbenzimidazole synthase [Myxococcota bacterium]|nr:5,6-dimethylbenzimidazole synthase [Myxococcota bacterium]
MSSHAFPELLRRGLYDIIAARRDMRSFLPDPLPEPTLARILDAAHHAGSVGFSQPWSFIVVRDRAVRERVHTHVEAERLRAAAQFEGPRRDKYLGLKLHGILDAPLNVCVTSDPTRHGPAVLGRATMPQTSAYSTCGAIQNLWLAARAEGVGVGWVSILEPDTLKEVLGIPPHVTLIGYLCVGFVEAFPPAPTLETAGWLPRMPLAETVFAERWGQAPAGALATALAEVASPKPPPAPPKGQGLVVVYTGHGKGKTTAALGIVFRALGRDMPVAVVQFIKGKWKTGERLFARALPNLTFLVMGEGFTWESDDLSRDARAAQAAWEQAKGLILGGAQAVVVLDEMTYAINYDFIPLADVQATLKARPAHVHVVITGRNAPEALVAQADLVTEMQPVKHPYEQGVRAQIGLDF